jgi:predicted acyltransferase
MILVNNPASWTYVFAPLRHAPWHGWTLTDLVFPFFLFIVGISISLSLSRRLAERKTGRRLYGKILKRSFLLLIIGWFLHLFPRFQFATMRIPGVLPRIALCYLAGAFVYLKVKGNGRRLAFASFLLVAYWAALTFIPVPGFGPGVLEEKGNLCGFIDKALLAGHLYRPDLDPEGLLSTIPAIATVILGILAGEWLRKDRTVLRKALGLFANGILLTALGLALHPYFPINKQLWTSTYVLFTAGMALLVFGLCYILIERMNLRRWAKSFIVLGANAITVFAGSTLMVKILMLIKIPEEGKTVSPIAWLYDRFLAPVAGPYLGSLVYPLLLILLWVALMSPLYRHRIFIKL